MKVVLVFYLLCLCTGMTKCEIYTATAGLDKLLNTEELLITALEEYIVTEESKIDGLKRYVKTYKNEHDSAVTDVESYIENPINAYKLVKRLTADWQEVEALVNKSLNTDFLSAIKNIKQISKTPTDEDLNGAAVALARLQDLYQLETSSIARGELHNVKYNSELSASDCFELGRQLYDNEDYYHSYLWLQEADARLNRENSENVLRSDILDYLAFSAFKQGNLNVALDLTNKLLELLPGHPRAISNKAYYSAEIEMQKFSNDEMGLHINESKMESYYSLCRGDKPIPLETSGALKCQYLRRNNPFLLIAPFKVEEVHHNPKVLLFHDVLADSEISTIMRLAKARFQRATVRNSDSNRDSKLAHYRIGKVAWLQGQHHKHVEDLSQRVSDMTDLTITTAERLQVVNYGIGGYFAPHFDYTPMTDVPQGGATVFTKMGLALWPKKGTAAFWYNLQPSGEGDKRTEHTACPVLVGSKWVCTLWLHEKGQEFVSPCVL